MTPFDQKAAACRCEWAATGHDFLAAADVVIVVDVLSFSTCVDIAAARGIAILPYPWQDPRAAAFAAAQRAELAGRRGDARYSLSPASFVDAPEGIRCVLPSPNGAALAFHAAGTSAAVLTGCLRNARAVAAAARRLGVTFNVCPAGEQWPDGSLRPAVEDWLGAGAILCRLPGSKSPEAAAAVAAFHQAEHNIPTVLASTSSARELTARGFGVDVELAAHYDVSDCAPRLEHGAFVRA